jgi:superfamily II DNA or RNA helicase
VGHALDLTRLRVFIGEKPNEPTIANMDPQRVRLIGDPGNIGLLGPDRAQRGGIIHCKVLFPSGWRWVPADQLEPLEDGQETPIDLLRRGRLGHAMDLRRTLVHVRLRGRLADMIYSMESTNTDFYAYQFKPVLKVLMCPAKGILVADEVGLGKTIEAGLIWTELRTRFAYRRLMVLCPAVLRDKWQLELRTRFGVRADILNAEQLWRRLNEEVDSPSPDGFAVVSSLQGLRPESNWDDEERISPRSQLARFLHEHEYEDRLFDLLVIDEAHYLRNPETQTNTLGNLLSRVAEHVLLLSATPVHLRSDDLYHLLRLLDPDTFNRPEAFDLILSANSPLVQARDEILRSKPDIERVRELIAQASATDLLHGSRQLAELQERLSGELGPQDLGLRSRLAYLLETTNLLGHVYTRTRKRDVTEWRVVRNPVAESVPMSGVEREFYDTVTEIVRDYCARRDINENFLLVTPQRQASSCMPAALAEWKTNRDESLDDDSIDADDLEIVQRKIGPLKRQLIQRADEFTSIDQLELNDSKFALVKSMLNEFFRNNPNEKIIIFSSFISTLLYLQRRLELSNLPCAVMHGKIRERKSDVIARFKTNPNLRVLLSSEVGSEGVDLQFCSRLINYDLPWNPMRVEQRIGRIDRIGQAAEVVTIWNLFYADTIDDRIYARLYDRLDLCRRTLGDFEAVLGDHIRRLTHYLLSGQLTREQEESRIEQTRQALEIVRQQEERLEADSAQLTAYGDYVLQQVRAAHDLNRWISANDIRTYVCDFFKIVYPETRLKLSAEAPDEVDISLSSDANIAFGDFVRRNRLRSNSRLLTSSGRPVRCRFDNRVVAPARAQHEVISHLHPLVKFMAAETERRGLLLRPAVAVRLDPARAPRNAESGVYLFFVMTWYVEGALVSEKLGFAAMRLGPAAEVLPDEDAEGLVLRAAMDGADWPEWRLAIDLDQAVQGVNDRLYEGLFQRSQEFLRERQNENEDRIDIQLRTLENHLAGQRNQLARIAAEHRRLGRNSLALATDGRLNRMEQVVSARIRDLQANRKLKHGQEDICVGVLLVERQHEATRNAV